MMTEAMSRLIGMIYDCALDATLYPPTLEAVRTELRFHNAAIEIWGDGLRSSVAISSGIPERWLQEMDTYRADIVAVWGGADRIASYPLEEPILQSQAVSPAVTEANRYFREWVQPQGIVDAVALAFAREPGVLGTLGLGRHGSAGPVTQAELECLRLLAPHFRRAASIGRLLELQTLRAQGFAAALERLSCAVFFVGPSLNLMFRNAAGEALVREKRVVAVRDGRLQLAQPDAQERLARAVAIAAANESNLERNGLALPLREQDNTMLVMHLLPLTRGAARGRLVIGAVAALFIVPAADSPLPSDALASIYDLTPAETRLAELLAQRYSLREVADILGVSSSTVGTHLARLFAKTGCHRQVDLVGLLHSLRPPFRDSTTMRELPD